MELYHRFAVMNMNFRFSGVISLHWFKKMNYVPSFNSRAYLLGYEELGVTLPVKSKVSDSSFQRIKSFVTRIYDH